MLWSHAACYPKQATVTFSICGAKYPSVNLKQITWANLTLKYRVKKYLMPC
jgi:hypothetical protein